MLRMINAVDIGYRAAEITLWVKNRQDTVLMCLVLREIVTID